ncbi:helix-turn-helix domain-containing protein [Pyruvatibacter sp.]|uniref:helix-turn-helix domain-containing protein n=1 Tax=Pyruvatibacter sp. TaxID=1981328 RepID=UPI0032ED54B9
MSAHSKSHVKPADWQWPDVKAALEKAGSSLAQIARDSGVDITAITGVKNRHLPTSQKRIADVIGMSPRDIWPSRYQNADRARKTRTRSMTCTRKGSQAA